MSGPSVTASCRREASTFFILFLPFNPQQLNDFVAQQLNDFLAGKHRLHRERSGSLGLLAVDAQSRSPACRADAGGGGLWSGALNAEGPETAPSLRRKMEWKLLLSGWLGTERVEASDRRHAGVYRTAWACLARACHRFSPQNVVHPFMPPECQWKPHPRCQWAGNGPLG